MNQEWFDAKRFIRILILLPIIVSQTIKDTAALRCTTL